MEKVPHVCYYITGHGLGHATRSLLTVDYLLSRGAKVSIVSSIDPSFFLSSLSHLNIDDSKNRLECFQRCLDSGAIQEHSLKVNSLETLQKYSETVHNHRNELLDIEVEFLQSRNVDLIIVDATPLACRAGKIAQVKVLLLTNFTWDFIYRELLLESETIDTITKMESSDEAFEQLNLMIDQCTSDYNDADVYAQLPGNSPPPKGFNSDKLIHTSLITRNFKKNKYEIKNIFEIPEGNKVLLLGFGGHQTEWNLKDKFLPKDWTCLVLGASQSDLPVSGKFRAVNYNCYVPDLINASDVVLGKLGYGTLSECLRHKKPLIYVPRSSWPEENCLITLLETNAGGLCMSTDDFLNGNWSPYLTKALELNNLYEKDSIFIEENSAIHQIFDNEKLIRLLELKL